MLKIDIIYVQVKFSTITHARAQVAEPAAGSTYVFMARCKSSSNIVAPLFSLKPINFLCLLNFVGVDLLLHNVVHGALYVTKVGVIVDVLRFAEVYSS